MQGAEPFLLSASGISEPGLWRFACGLLLLGLTAGTWTDVRDVRRADRSEWTRFDRVLQWLIPLLGVGALSAQGLSVAGVWVRPFAAYLGGLFFLLFFSSVMFVRLLTAPEPDTQTRA